MRFDSSELRNQVIRAKLVKLAESIFKLIPNVKKLSTEVYHVASYLFNRVNEVSLD